MRHRLAGILGLALCAVVAGARSFTTIAEWAGDADEQTLHLLGVRGAVPSESTFRRTLQRLDADAFDGLAGALAVLSTRFSAPADWLRAGQALQRVLLTAAARGVATTPLTQPLETADAWLVRDPRSGVEEPQMILRLGYGLPVPPTPRRPVCEVLDLPPENLPPGKEDL